MQFRVSNGKFQVTLTLEHPAPLTRGYYKTNDVLKTSLKQIADVSTQPHISLPSAELQLHLCETLVRSLQRAGADHHVKQCSKTIPLVIGLIGFLGLLAYWAYG